MARTRLAQRSLINSTTAGVHVAVVCLLGLLVTMGCSGVSGVGGAGGTANETVETVTIGELGAVLEVTYPKVLESAGTPPRFSPKVSVKMLKGSQPIKVWSEDKTISNDAVTDTYLKGTGFALVVVKPGSTALLDTWFEPGDPPIEAGSFSTNLRFRDASSPSSLFLYQLPIDVTLRAP